MLSPPGDGDLKKILARKHLESVGRGASSESVVQFKVKKPALATASDAGPVGGGGGGVSSLLSTVAEGGAASVTSLMSKRLLSLCLDTGEVRYSSREPGAQHAVMPKTVRISPVLAVDRALDFAFGALLFKDRLSNLRLVFKSKMERITFELLFEAYCVPADVDDFFGPQKRTGSSKGSRSRRGSVDFSSNPLLSSILPPLQAPQPPPSLPVAASPASVPSLQLMQLNQFKRQMQLMLPDNLSVFCGTWNVGNETVPVDLSRWIPTKGVDMYVICAQEARTTKKQQGEEVKNAKLQDKRALGEILITGINQMQMGEVDVSLSGNLGKFSMRKVKDALAHAPEMVVLREERAKALEEYERRCTEEAALRKEAKKEKSKADAHQAKKLEMEAAKRAWLEKCKQCKERKATLRKLARLVNKEQLAQATVQDEKHKKKDTHFINRLRSFVTTIVNLEATDPLEELSYRSLWGLKMAVFARRSLFPYITCVESCVVACGGPNQKYGNKGAVGISMCLGSSSLLFVGAHLAAHAEKLKQRNANYHHIVNNLDLGLGKEWPLNVQFDHCFFLGDLNYRLETDTQTVIEHYQNRDNAISEDARQKFLESHDQLTKAIRSAEAFRDFEPDYPRFYPTFKLSRGLADVVVSASAACDVPQQMGAVLHTMGSNVGSVIHAVGNSVGSVLHHNHNNNHNNNNNNNNNNNTNTAVGSSGTAPNDSHNATNVTNSGSPSGVNSSVNAPVRGSGNFAPTDPNSVVKLTVSADRSLFYSGLRVPSLCDRVLVRSIAGRKGRIRRQSYEAAFEVAGVSDHAPVSSLFSCQLDRQPRQLAETAEELQTFVVLYKLQIKFVDTEEELSDNARIEISCPSLFSPTLETWASVKDNSLFPRGAASVFAGSSFSLDYLRTQRLFIKVVSPVKCFGVLRLENAFANFQAGGVPFDVELFAKSDVTAGRLTGFISSQQYK